MLLKEKTSVRCVRLAVGILAGVIAGQAFAQEAKVEAVYVTGTRITTPGTTSNNPITSISAEEIKSSQPVAVEEFFKGMPSAVPAIGPGTNNGTGGGATIDLRGLGTNRTLVLVNGRRLVPFNLNGTVDTNSIPVALINRVDLVTGGASVVYGADAVSGVANFNLKRNFNGFEVNTSYGATMDERDAKRKRTDITMGANLADGKGNVVLSVGKTKADPLTQGSRPYGVTNLNSVTGAGTGSNTTVPAAFSVAKGTGGTDTLAGAWQINPSNGTLFTPLVQYNTNPLNYYVTGLEREQATGMGNYKINDHAEVYAEVFYTASRVASTLAESGTFGNVFQVPIGNPFMPQPMREQICARRGIPAASCISGNNTMVPMTVDRRFVELGPRFNNFDNKTLQTNIGVKGDLFWDWTYDAYWGRGNADQVQTRLNWGSLSKVTQALNALNTTTCVTNTNGCVPLNVFGAAGSITPAMLNFINLSALLNTFVQQDVAAASFSGDLGKLKSPWADSPISMAIGLESRKVIASNQSDGASQIQSEVLGTGAPTPDRRGQFNLKEASVEWAVPLLQNKPFAHALNAELGYRETEFSTATSEKSYGSWKAGGEWAPVKQFRIRGMIQKATRAPNVNELFQPQVTGLSNLAVDPCQGNKINQADVNKPGTLSNLCRETGVPATEVGSLAAPSSGQINNLTGGNPELGPEQAKTKTLGFVWEPLPKLAFTFDYYKINIWDAISTPSTTDVLDGCYSTSLNPSLTFNASCALIGRNPANGTFNGAASRGVATARSNLGTQSTAGFDINVAYRLNATQLNWDAKWGTFDITFAYNKVREFLFKATPSSVERDCLGFYSVACANIVNAPVFKQKFNQRTTWKFGQFAVGYNWRYIGAVNEEPGGQVFLPAFAHIDAYNYVDLSAKWNINKNVALDVAINNAANKKPPIVGGTIGGTGPNSGNTFPQSYDAVGRYITLGLTAKF